MTLPEPQPFIYRARPEYVIDGDTVDCTIDLGFETYLKQRVRLLGVDTREIHGVRHDSEEYKRGLVHKSFVEQWMHEAVESEATGEWPLYLYTRYGGRGKYGRVLARVRSPAHEQLLGDALLDAFDDVEVYE